MKIKLLIIVWILGISATADDVGIGTDHHDSLTLREQVWTYVSSEGALSELRKRIQSREEELKPLLLELLDEYEITDPGADYGWIAMLTLLSRGLEDKEFDRDFWRKVMIKHKDYSFGTPAIFREYLEYDPEGAEETFRQLLEIGSEDVKAAAEKFLEKIKRKKNGRNGGLPPNIHPKETNTSLGQSNVEKGGGARSGGGTLLIVLGATGLLGIVAILIRSSLRQRRAG